MVAASSHLSGSALVWSLVVAAVLILLNGMFVAYEFAILAARRSEFDADSEKRTIKASLLSLSDLSMQLAGAQLGITMVSLGLGFVGEPAFESIIEPIIGRAIPSEVSVVISIVLSLAIVVFLHLVIGEMVPKNMALAAPNATLRWLVLPYRMYLWLFRPLALLLNGLANAGCRVVGVVPRDELIAVHSISELSAIVSRSSQEGAIEVERAELLRGALSFSERSVGEVAVPIAELQTVRYGATPAQVERVVAASGQGRIPVVGPPGQQLVGYINARDLVMASSPERTAPVPKSALRRILVVPAHSSLVETLRIMRRNRLQLAVVVDQDSDPVGLVSVEDIIQALLPADPVASSEESPK